MFHNDGGPYDFKFLLKAIAYLQSRSDDAACEGEGEESQVNGRYHLRQRSPVFWDEASMDEDVDLKKLSLSVLFKSGEKLLQFRFGNLVFLDSFNFYNSSLSKLMDEQAKTVVDGDYASKHIASVHPLLQPGSLMPERRRWLRLRSRRRVVRQEVLPEVAVGASTAEVVYAFDHMTSPGNWTKGRVWHVNRYSSKLKAQLAAHKLLRKIQHDDVALVSCSEVHPLQRAQNPLDALRTLRQLRAGRCSSDSWGGTLVSCFHMRYLLPSREGSAQRQRLALALGSVKPLCPTAR